MHAYVYTRPIHMQSSISQRTRVRGRERERERETKGEGANEKRERESERQSGKEPMKSTCYKVAETVWACIELCER